MAGNLWWGLQPQQQDRWAGMVVAVEFDVEELGDAAGAFGGEIEEIRRRYRLA